MGKLNNQQINFFELCEKAKYNFEDRLIAFKQLFEKSINESDIYMANKEIFRKEFKKINLQQFEIFQHDFDKIVANINNGCDIENNNYTFNDTIVLHNIAKNISYVAIEKYFDIFYKVHAIGQYYLEKSTRIIQNLFKRIQQYPIKHYWLNLCSCSIANHKISEIRLLNYKSNFI